MDESNLNDILFPKPKKIKKHRKRSGIINKRSGRTLLKIFSRILLILIVLAFVFSFADIGGNIIFGLAKNYLAENYELNLEAENISGNPIKGYKINNFELSDKSGNKLLSAGFLSGRINFAALFSGNIRLAELSLGNMSMDIDTLFAAINNINLPQTKSQTHTFSIITPAFAEQENYLPEIPLDRFSLKNSTFTSNYGTIKIHELGADLRNFDIDINAQLNEIPIKGVIDMGESAGLTAINRSDINFGSGKILATGGFINDKLDFHVSLENLNLQELTGLYPQLLSHDDFEGNANMNLDVTGEIKSPRIFGTIDYKGSKIYGFPFERASSNVDYNNYRLSLNNIQANIFNIPIQGEIAAANRPDEKISVLIKLDGSEANLEGLDKILGVPELKGLSGKVDTFNANISGYIDELSGLVNFTAPKISYSERAFTNIRAQMKLTKSDSAHVDGKFNFENAQGYLQGSVASVLTSPNMNLTAKIVDLDIKRVENMIPDASDYKLSGKITASLNVKGTTNNPTISGSLNSPEFSGFDQKITKPSINFTFANKTLTLSKTEGTLNGMPVNLSGTINPLPSSNPNLNINATISMSPDSLKNYVPDISQYHLKGNINAGLRIQGSVNNPSVNLIASSQNLQALDMINAKDIELTTALNGDLSKLSKISINAAAKSIIVNGMTFSGVNAKIDENNDKIILGGFNAKSGNGTINGSGTADISGKSPLDFNFNFNNLNLKQLAANSGINLEGSLSGKLKISGTNENPEINFNADIPTLNAQGFKLSNIIAEISGNFQKIMINKLRGDFDGEELTVNGNIALIPEVKADIAVNGNIKTYGVKLTNINIPLSYANNKLTSSNGTAKLYSGTLKNNLTLDINTLKFTDNFEAVNVNLGNLINDTAPDMKNNFSGKTNLSLNITGTGANINAKGKLTSSALKAYNINLTNINLPLSYTNNNLSSQNGTAKLYSGNLKNNLNFDINAMRFSDNIDASGVDVNSFIQDISGGLEGKITGTGKLTLSLNGTIKDKTNYSGTGNFSMGSGMISGFKWLDIAAKIHNTKGINYINVNAPFTIQTGKLILKSGTIANAPKNDPMYKYAKLTQNGTVDFSKQDTTLNFMTESSINYQLINAIQGGSKGGFEALFKGGISNFEDGLKAFLSGGLKEAEKTASTGDFRVVNLKISGKASSPSFSGLKIGPSTIKQTTTTTTKQSDDKKQESSQSSQSLKDKIIDRTIDVIAPNLNQNKNQNQNQNQNTQQKQNLEDKLKEELRKGLEKGLGGLLKR